MTQNQAQAFSGGLESASSVASSGILTSLWNLISDLYAEAQSSNQNLFWKIVSYESGLTVIAFGTTQSHDQPPLLPFSNTDDNPFKFICSKANPNFSLDSSSFSLFNQCRTTLDQLKSVTDLKKPVIVTGRGVGGSIASLFTLWLLEKMEPSDKRPLCITFGSPLIGDQHFRKAMWQSSNWNSCFLHVASLLDPLVSSSISNDSYSPFGIFLLCSDYGSSCFESPVSVRMLLKLTSQLNQGLQQNCDYGSILENLHRKAICKDFDGPNISHSNLLQESLALQLCALGFPQLLQLKESDLKDLVKDLNKEVVKQKKRCIPNKKLDDMKINMANLEWYKKKSKQRGIGYYDMFKDQQFEPDMDVNRYIKELNLYWEDMVEEAEKQPQKEGATLRTRWLYGGTNYRRMVEPLDIARYYKDGKRDYINKGRPEHYKQLEKWLKEDKKSESIGRTNNVESILTLDSCFWARAEEALISCRKLKATESNEAEKLEAVNSLNEFEEYLYGELKKYAVSPEIFLGGSSFMRWWGEYIRIKGGSHDSEFANFMKNPTNYEKYVEGAYHFH